MGTGWRRAFCTSTLPRNSDVGADVMTDDTILPASPGTIRCTRKLGFFSQSNPTTPRLRCRTSPRHNSNPPSDDSPALRCKTATHKVSKSKSPRPLLVPSESNSPRSPLKLSLFRNSFRSRSNCGVCAQSVKTGQGMAIYTAECGHAFHFPCIAAHVRKEGKLACPVCNICWKDVPLLAVQTSSETILEQDKSIVAETKISTPKSAKNAKDSSPRQEQYHHCQLKPVVVLRAYDDDESLLTPTMGGKFNPIPEAEEENEEEQVEEFQGFFVNHIPSCSLRKPQLMANDSRSVDVKPMPEAAILSVNQSYETYALALKVKAPSITPQTDWSCRAPTDLVAVVDVSGSMNGSKLYMLKRAMRLIISSLSASDRLSIVAFSATTKRLLPLQRMSQQGQLSARRIIDQLICGQGSNAGDALKKAIKVLEDRRERNSTARIMLLSDGQDGRSVNHLIPSFDRFPHIRIPVHAFSYGKISSNAAEDTFSSGLGCLLSVVVPDLRIKLKLNIIGADITAVYCNNFQPALLGSDSIRLGDLYSDEERELLVEVRIPRSISGTTRPVLTARCSYKNQLDRESINLKELAVHLPKLQPIRSTVPNIERLRNLFIATRAIAEARGLVEDCKDYSNAHRLLMSAKMLVLQSSTSEMTSGEYVRGLEMELMELARRYHQQQQQQQQEKVVLRKQHKEWDLGLVDENGDPLTPTSAWRAAEMLAKVAMIKKSLNKVSDLHGFENARF